MLQNTKCHVGFKKLLGNPAFDYLKTKIEVNSKKKVKREKYIREDTHKKVWGGGLNQNLMKHKKN